MPIEVELKKYSDKELRFVIHDPDKHSLPNMIARLALKKKGVVYAAYMIEHPMVSSPEVVIVTDGSRDPLDVLIEVIEEAKNIAQTFLKHFDEALSNIAKKGE